MDALLVECARWEESGRQVGPVGTEGEEGWAVPPSPPGTAPCWLYMHRGAHSQTTEAWVPVLTLLLSSRDSNFQTSVSSPVKWRPWPQPCGAPGHPLAVLCPAGYSATPHPSTGWPPSQVPSRQTGGQVETWEFFS